MVLLDNVDRDGEGLELGDEESLGEICICTWAKAGAEMILACVSVAFFHSVDLSIGYI